MTAALSAAGCVELATLERSGLIESRHLGAAVLLDHAGAVQHMLGDGSALVYPRSTLKPLQAVAMLRAGAPLEGERLALATSSHSGTAEHVRVVRSILDLAGLDESALRCPADWPSDGAARAGLTAAGGGPSAIYMNCAGKHAAFLLTCRVNGWPTEDYLDPAHPLQRMILAGIEELAREKIRHGGVDGCGAPVPALSLHGLALGIGWIPSSRGIDPAATALMRAILDNPWAIDGPGRSNTVTIERLGIVAKLGAEGVMVMAAQDGTAVAVKILDGSGRAATLVALELLVRAGVVGRAEADEVLEKTLDPVLGGGLPVGAIRVAF